MDAELRYTQLGFEVIASIDRGISVSVDDLRQHIDDDNIFQFLRDQDPEIDHSVFTAEDRAAVMKFFATLAARPMPGASTECRRTGSACSPPTASRVWSTQSRPDAATSPSPLHRRRTTRCPRPHLLPPHAFIPSTTPARCWLQAARSAARPTSTATATRPPRPRFNSKEFMSLSAPLRITLSANRMASLVLRDRRLVELRPPRTR